MLRPDCPAPKHSLHLLLPHHRDYTSKVDTLMHERREAQVRPRLLCTLPVDGFMPVLRKWFGQTCSCAQHSAAPCKCVLPHSPGPPPFAALQEARKSEEDQAKEQEQAANAYLHLNSYLALPPPSAAPDGGMGGQQPYGGGYGGMPQQF